MSGTAGTKSFMAMKAAGYYSKATIGAKHVMDNAVGLVLDAVEAMRPGEASGAFRATDMGAADGGTSVDLWRRVLGRVRELAPDRPIEMIYTDLPRNDFSQIFRMVHGLTEIESYLPQIPETYVFASGSSFFEPIVPPASLDLGFSSTASHYIEAAPAPIANHVHMVGAAPEERAAYAAKGAEDWRRMLLQRSRELKPGGRLCLFNFGIDEKGRYLGNTGGVNMFDTFARLWRGLVDDGIITEAEFRATNFPQCYRTEEEFTRPLTDPEDPVAASGLRLEHVESRVVRCPFERDFTEGHGDATGFAEEYVPTLRSWSEPTFAAGLDPARPEEERARILDEFYDRYRALVAENPEGHAMDYVHIYLVCRKEG